VLRTADGLGLPWGFGRRRRKLQGLTLKLSEQTDRRWLWLDVDEMVGRLNRLLRGWGNYFCLGTVAAAYRKVMYHACGRLRQWLVKKCAGQGSKWSRYSDQYLQRDAWGLLRLRRHASNLRERKA